MGRPKKSDAQKDADKKGESRMERYEKRQSEPIVKSNRRSVTYWEKVDTGPWEEKEYVYNIA